MKNSEKKPRRFFLGLLLSGIHSALFILVAILIAFSSDGEAGMVYYIFFWLDYPISHIFAISPELGTMFFLGGLLWFSYGWLIQAIISIRSRYGLYWLTSSVSFLVLLLLLPELTLRSLPD